MNHFCEQLASRNNDVQRFQLVKLQLNNDVIRLYRHVIIYSSLECPLRKITLFKMYLTVSYIISTFLQLVYGYFSEKLRISVTWTYYWDVTCYRNVLSEVLRSSISFTILDINEHLSNSSLPNMSIEIVKSSTVWALRGRNF